MPLTRSGKDTSALIKDHTEASKTPSILQANEPLSVKLQEKRKKIEFDLKKRREAIEKKYEQELLKLQLNEEIAIAELEAENNLLQINKEFHGVSRSLDEIVTNEATNDVEDSESVMQAIYENIQPQRTHTELHIPQVRRGLEGTAAHKVYHKEKSLNHSPVHSTINRSFQENPLITDEQFQMNSKFDTSFLPRPEILKFDGKLENYLSFLFSFDTNIDCLNISDRKKLCYLFQYCTESVVQRIRCCVQLPPSEGYRRAREILKDLYGNPHNLARTCLNKLIQGPQIKPNDLESLKQLAIDMVETEINMESLSYQSDLSSVNCLHQICSRLPSYLRSKWAEEADKIITFEGRDPKFRDLRMFIQKRSRIANSMYGQCMYNNSHDSQILQSQRVQENLREKRDRKTFMLQGDAQDDSENFERIDVNVNNLQKGNASSVSLQCVACNGICKHVSVCSVFKSMTLEQRLDIAKKFRLCFNCLCIGHVGARCTKEKQCPVQGCKGKHNALLHSWNRVVPETVDVQVGTSMACSSQRKYNSDTKVCLNVVPVKISHLNQSLSCYALLDTGSDISLCSEELVQKLNLVGKKVSYNITTLANQNFQKVGEEVDFRIGSVNGEFSLEVKGVWSCSELPKSKNSVITERELAKFSHLKHIRMPIVDYPEVMVLIGNDLPQLLVPTETKVGKTGDPIGLLGPLGWSVIGPINHFTSSIHTSRIQEKHVNFVITNEDLNRQVENLWKLDSVEKLSDKVAMSQEDIVALNIMKNSVHKDQGHYNIALPWRNMNEKLPNNKSMALMRLNSLKRKLIKDKVLHEMYVKQITDYLDKGYAKAVENPQHSSQGKTWYLPHHPVTSDKKPGKVRVVFDCAAIYDGVSLNSKLLQGPDYLNRLVGVFLRFRSRKIAIASDIEAMFHQVKVKEADTDSLRFLWWPDGNLNAEPQTYKMLVHLFGGKSSPSCAAFALRQAAYDQVDEFSKEVIDVVLDNFYVDDCLMSENSVEIACEKADQVRTLLSNKGFKLTKWISSNQDVINSIPESLRAPKVKELSLDKDAITDCTLGIQWGVSDDTLSFKVKITEKPATKRGILTVVSSLFDPCGLVAPIALPAKILIQSLWREKLGWDEKISQEKLAIWEKWKSSVQALTELQIPRYFKAHLEGNKYIRLHIFTDASESAYGACVYITVEAKNGIIESYLVFGKSRLAPLKVMSIPRLELKAAVLGCHLGHMVKEELKVEFTSVNYWTDSMLVLNYIQNKTKRFKTFIANRISEIHGFTEPEDWKYVSTKINPADHASRGILTEDKEKLNEWLHGPRFIQRPIEDWPKDDKQIEQNIDLPEVKGENSVVLCSIKENNIGLLLERYSKHDKLVHAIAWLLRFKDYIKGKYGKTETHVTKGLITVEELKTASLVVVKLVQSKHFADDICSLKGNIGLSKHSSIRKLYPKLEGGILRVGGRLCNSPIGYDSKHPIILPSKCHVTKLLIRKVHEENGHIGVHHVLTLLRNKYWVISGISTVRNELGKCILCRKCNQVPSEQLMGNLPRERVEPDKPPFSYTGVDYFGPILIKQARSRVKRYGCLFTCMTTRAIHIEVAHSLNKDSFLGALTRFISRRGKPIKLFSDNGKNFVGAEREMKLLLKEINQSEFCETLTQKGIEWDFITPLAPFKGGVWERMIKSVKKILSMIVREQILTEESLCTFMSEVERILNSRPITYVSSDARDPSPLSPSKLLLMKANDSIPPGLFNQNDNYGRRWWRQIHYLSGVFWRRWMKEYLPQLQVRQKWQVVKQSFTPGDLVLLLDTTTQRGVWPMAVIEKVIESSDGLVRSCIVRTNQSQFKRPVTLLCNLEMNVTD